MKYVKWFAVVLVLCLCVSGCGLWKTDPLEDCREAVAALAEQEEILCLSRTFVGETEETMESTGVWEYRISGEDRLVIAPAGAEDELWTLYMDGQCFKTVPEKESRRWEAVQEEGDPDPWVPPEVDLGAYEVRTGKDANGRRTVTLSGDRVVVQQTDHGDVTASGYRVEYALNADGTLASWSMYYTMEFLNAEGQMDALHWRIVMEYPAFEAGEIAGYLDTLYAEATE